MKSIMSTYAELGTLLDEELTTASEKKFIQELFAAVKDGEIDRYQFQELMYTFGSRNWDAGMESAFDRMELED